MKEKLSAYECGYLDTLGNLGCVKEGSLASRLIGRLRPFGREAMHKSYITSARALNAAEQGVVPYLKELPRAALEGRSLEARHLLAALRRQPAPGAGVTPPMRESAKDIVQLIRSYGL
jgi:hypothetical protein